MHLELPQFVKEIARARAAEAGVDVATYVAAVICADEERRCREEAELRARAASLFVPEGRRLALLEAFHSACERRRESAQA